MLNFILVLKKKRKKFGRLNFIGIFVSVAFTLMDLNEVIPLKINTLMFKSQEVIAPGRFSKSNTSLTVSTNL